MSKKDRRAKARLRLKRRKQERRTQQSRTKRVLAWLISPGGLIFWLLAVMTIAVTYFSFKSSVSVEIERPVNPREPFPAIFKITNESWLSIYHIKRTVGVRDVQTSAGGGMTSLRYDDSAPEIPNLEAKETATVVVQMPYGKDTQYTVGDIDVTIDYSTFVRTKKTQRFRFMAAREFDGSVHWFHRAKSER